MLAIAMHAATCVGGHSNKTAPAIARGKERGVTPLLIQRDQCYDKNLIEISRIEERLAHLKRQ